MELTVGLLGALSPRRRRLLRVSYPQRRAKHIAGGGERGFKPFDGVH